MRSLLIVLLLSVGFAVGAEFVSSCPREVAEAQLHLVRAGQVVGAQSEPCASAF